MAKQLCISADSHVVEPPELFDPLQSRFGERAPRIEFFNGEKNPQLYLGDGRYGIGITGLFQAGFDFSRPDANEIQKMGYKLARPGVYDIKARLEDQDIDGIDAEVLYCSILFNVYSIEDTEIVKATFAAYNDWVADYCKEAPERLFPLACLQLRDIDAAIAEMERAKLLGHVGVSIPASAPPEHPYTDEFYDRFWAAAQEMRMPLTMHVFTGATANHGVNHRSAGYALAHTGMMFTIYDLIYGGVCEKYPDIRFVPTEFETGWVGNMLRRLDWTWFRGGGGRREGTLPRKPSEYWKQNFLVTFEDDDIGIMTRHISGTNTMMWGSDYPHGDSVFPDSQGVLDRILADCTPEERYEMTVKNVVNLYGLPFEV
ncbi:MAG: amidohydrolase family protein [Dehalococcoidia bacterium]